MKLRTKLLGTLAAGLLLAALAVQRLNHLDESAPRSTPFQSNPALVERGAYLARAGNCMGCHTARGGADYAGGRAIPTPFGSVFTSNLTPDVETGLGRWSADEFWTALHNGRGRDGRLLTPAFPYDNYALVTREDSDALFAYLQSLPAVAQPRREHELRFPYNTQAALAVWAGAVLPAGGVPARCAAHGRMEPWCLPEPGPGPLQCLSRQPQQPGCHGRPERLLGRHA